MQLPFTVIVELPNRAELRSIARKWRTWVIAGGIVATTALAVVVLPGLVRRESAVGSATLRVSSVPPAATVTVDGRMRGRTPISIVLPPGNHRVTVGGERHTEVTYHVSLKDGQTATIAAELWLRTPHVQRLRPPFPGATIEGADFLHDGRVALTVAIPPTDERQLWLVDGNGAIRRMGPPDARGSLAVSPDGEQVAYLAASQRSNTAGRLDEVWITRHNGEYGDRHYALPTSDERLVDLSWAPDGQHLLVVSRTQLPGGGRRTRVRWLRLGGDAPKHVVDLPTEFVPGSYAWSPDGQRLAFLTRSGQLTSLGLLGTTDGELRYLADLNRNDPDPLPIPPIAWSPDGQRLLFAAPNQDQPSVGGWLFGPTPTDALFLAEATRPVARRLDSAEGQSPAWRENGHMMALARSNGGSLVLRQVELGGAVHDLAEIPLKAATRFAARWDAGHAQAIIAVRGSASLGTSQPEYWLVRFREVGR